MPDSQSHESLLAEGQSLLRAGNKAQALARFQVAAKLDPKSETAWLLIAKATEDVDEGIYALGQALSLNPANMEARNMRLALQVGNLREGVYANVASYRESPFRRIIRPVLIVLAVIALVIAVVVAGYFVMSWLNERAFAQSLQAAIPTIQSAAFPPTWTPQPTATFTPTPPPTKTPVATATPKFVTGQINAAVNSRSGPGTSFPVSGSLAETTVVILVGVSTDGSFYQVHLPDDDKLLWVSADFVDVIGGDESMLPEVIVPTPRPIIRATSVPVPPTNPPPPPAPQSFSFSRSKVVNNPYPRQCNVWDIHGTVWTAVPDASQPITGMLVRVWINGVVYKTDSSGSRGPTHMNAGYWEVDFPPGNAVSGLVAMVNSDNWLISPQFPFALTAHCGDSNDVNEMIIDFSPR